MKRRALSAIVVVTAASSPALAQYTLNTLTIFNGADGSTVLGGLILCGDTLYGTTAAGGANGDGEVFSLPTTGGAPNVLTSFNGTNGQWPQGQLIASGGTLYGTTNEGGANGNGEVFSLPITGGTPTVLASFNGTNGNGPSGQLLLFGNTIYGTTETGGANNDGEVFSLPLTGGMPNVLASFNVANGYSPNGGLILSGSTLYGTTYEGGNGVGAFTDGTLFSLPITGGTLTVLVAFDNVTDGSRPVTNLIMDSTGNLYGATLYGTTPYAYGEVYSVTTTGGTPTVLTTFDGTNGQGPDGSLLFSEGTLYGTTYFAGTYGLGEVYSLPAIGGAPTVLASFDGTDGYYVPAGLVADAAGNLYGITEFGGGPGGNGSGTVFEISATPVPSPSAPGLVGICTLCLFRRTRRSAQLPIYPIRSS